MPITNDESGDDIELYIFVQEMHDKYEKYADARIPLSNLCKIGQKGGGWIQLDESAGKVLLSYHTPLHSWGNMWVARIHISGRLFLNNGPQKK